MAKAFLDSLQGEGIGLTLIGIELSLSLQTLIKDDALIGGTLRFFSEAKGGANSFKGFIVRILQVLVADKGQFVPVDGQEITEVSIGPPGQHRRCLRIEFPSRKLGGQTVKVGIFVGEY